MPYTQENRLIAIDTPLGTDVLLLTGFSGAEGLSSLFSFELDMLSENHSIAFKDIIGKNVTVSIVLADGDKRFVNGIISRFSQGRGGGEEGGDPRFSQYRATMVPWLWLLTITADSRIFQKLSVPDIVEKIFSEKGFKDFEMRLHGSYDQRDYCVQYRETDFNFVSRLLEEEGIYYFFEHDDKKHTLILADVPEEHKPCPKQESARYQLSAGGWLEKDVVTSLEVTQEIRPGKYTLNDFNFETPNTDLKVETPGRQTLGPGEREIYDYPGDYSKRAQGDRLSNIRMQEEEAKITNIVASSVCRAFTSGYRFDLLDYYRGDMNEKSYVLTSVNHGATEPVGGSGQGSEASYTNSFTCIPFDVSYRPPRVTPKPVVEGTQTAIVVGPAGEEIYTDEHGRVKVQFHWDREGKKDENSSCWIRVSQVWAGAGWGAMYIPRIGHEVIVNFIEGDPDRPIITGRVYHGTNKPPYGLPDEKTKSTIKSDSSLGGGGSNEIRFEDKKGNEEIFLHGQKDWTIAIENDKNQTVGHDETLSVGNNRTIKVDADHTEEIGGSMVINVSKTKSETVTINSAETIGAAKELTIGGLYQVSVGGAHNETVGGAKMEEVGLYKAEAVGAKKSVTVAASYTKSIGDNESVSIGGDQSEDVRGKSSKTIKKEYTLKAKKITVQAEDEIALVVGKATIIMKKNGEVLISGKDLNSKASGKISIKASSDITIKGSKIKEN